MVLNPVALASRSYRRCLMNEPPVEPGVSYEVGGQELLDRVEPLWLELRDHHSAASVRFGDQLRSITFDGRRTGLVAGATSGLWVALAVSDPQDVGYCIASISPSGEGNIDSLFVKAGRRGQGIGEALVRRALDWFEQRSVSSISVEVLVGNEAALPFYERFGFYPRTHRLRRLTTGS